MSKCQLCSKEVDEREIQEQIGFSLCLSCDCKYTDQELTENQMIAIIKDNGISKCTKAEKEQVMAFAFGEDYMESDDKGSKKIYKESE